MTIIEFADWLQAELDIREMKPKTLADKAHLDPGIISRVLSRERLPSPDSLTAISGVLGYPPETVFRAAGLLPKLTNPITEYQEILDFSLSTLDGDQLMEVLQFIEFIKQRDKQPVKQTSKPAKQNREGISPPETVK